MKGVVGRFNGESAAAPSSAGGHSEVRAASSDELLSLVPDDEDASRADAGDGNPGAFDGLSVGGRLQELTCSNAWHCSANGSIAVGS